MAEDMMPGPGQPRFSAGADDYGASLQHHGTSQWGNGQPPTVHFAPPANDAGDHPIVQQPSRRGFSAPPPRSAQDPRRPGPRYQTPPQIHQPVVPGYQHTAPHTSAEAPTSAPAAATSAPAAPGDASRASGQPAPAAPYTSDSRPVVPTFLPPGPASQVPMYTGATILVTLVAVGMWFPVVVLDRGVPIPAPHLWAVLLLFVAFAAAEMFPLSFETRSRRLDVSLSEMPLVIGALFLPPWLVLCTYLIAAGSAFAARRVRVSAGLLNLALIAVETGAAFLIIGLWPISAVDGRLLDVIEPRLFPVAVGVIAGAALSAITVGIIRHVSTVSDVVTRETLRSIFIAAVVVGLVCAGVIVWLALAAGPIVCLVLFAVSVLIYRAYYRFMKRHEGLSALYAFGSDVARAGVDLDAWQNLAQRVRDQLNARAAALYIAEGAAGATVLAAGPNGPITVSGLDEEDDILVKARRDGYVVAVQDPIPDPAIAEILGRRKVANVMVVALKSGDRLRGYVTVWDARSRLRRFSDDDVQLLQTLGGHLATAIDNQQLVSSLKNAAYYDSATSLYNRSGLELRAAEASGAGDRPGMLLVQLNILADVTSALGHDRGEQLLASVGELLVDITGSQYVVGRVDSDRFVVLLSSDKLREADTPYRYSHTSRRTAAPSVPDGPDAVENAAIRFAQDVLDAVGQAITVDTVEVEPNVVAGIAFVDEPAPDTNYEEAVSGLLQRAQLALESARARDEKIGLYRPAIGQDNHRRFQLVSQFRHAVDSGRVTVHYQPKLQLSTRELIGVEALVRWMHPEYGFVSPAELIAAIEPTSAIDVLFAHVLDTALAQIHGWLLRGMRIAVAVNLSVRNLLAPNLVETVAAKLAAHGVPSELLTLEVTESSVMSRPERSLAVLQELHSMGIRLSVDDFGTGYSSLAYLRRLPIDELKIDRSFVQGMVTDLGDLAIVRAIIDLGHSLGMNVLAEGVEEETGRDALKSMRCDAMQGYLLSRPLPIDRFEAWLHTRMVQSDDLASTTPKVPTIQA